MAACAKPELIHDDFGPDASLLHGESLTSKKKSARSSLEHIEDNSNCPLPLYYTKQDDMNIDRKVAESKLECDNESANMERSAESRGDIEHAMHEARTAQQQYAIHPSGASRFSNFDDESIFHPPPEEADLEHEVARSNAERNVHGGHSIDTHLVKAWAVDEGSDSEKSVYMAEELIETPWWRQRRTKLLLVVLVVFVVLAITLGLVNSQDVATISSAVVIRSQSPSVSLTPTSSPSNAPSSSPTECVKRIYSSMQRIDLGGEDSFSSVAVDGSNMVVVSTGVFGDYNGTVINFFSLTSVGVWEKSTSIEAGLYSLSNYASLSGKTAFVYSEDIGDYVLPNNIFVYEQNIFGEWEKVQDPIEFGFLFSLDIDGDLACISEWGGQTHILHRNDSKWIYFDTKNGTKCDVFGDTVAIKEKNTQENNITTVQMHLFKYDEIQNALSPIQDPIPSEYCGYESWALSNQYLAFWDNCDEALYIYRFDPESESYIFHQQINMEGFPFHDIGMDDDVLVVAGLNETFIFVDQDGTWVESVSIDDSGFQELSVRNAIFESDRELRAYSILEDCTQQMPTSTPSSEPSSASPTYSSAPSVSLSPSTSSSPTQCAKWVQLDLQINDPQWPMVAVDGSNLVVAVCDGDCSFWNETGLVSIQFYSLANTGEWTTNSLFQFNATELNDVALSGNTALVSFWGSPPLVFEQSTTGEWGIMSDPFVYGDNATKKWWAYKVDVEGDLACFWITGGPSTSLFRRNGSKWTEVDNFPTSYHCALSDGMIAMLQSENTPEQIQLYEYNENQDAVLPTQDPIILDLEYAVYELALSNDYLVYSQNDTVFVYQRNSVNQTYIIHQELTVKGYYIIWDFSFYENTLVVAATDYQTHIFLEQNGSWVERTVLDQGYDSVAVSGQNLVASTDTEVHSYNLQNIEDCMAPTPSSTPSLKP